MYRDIGREQGGWGDDREALGEPTERYKDVGREQGGWEDDREVGMMTGRLRRSRRKGTGMWGYR